MYERTSPSEQQVGLGKPCPQALARIPSLGETKDIPAGEKLIHLHFVLIHAHWYVAEFDGADTFFGFIDPGDSILAEWGYFRLSDLQEARALVPIVDPCTGWREGVLPVAVEYDESWEIKPFGEVNRRHSP